MDGGACTLIWSGSVLCLTLSAVVTGSLVHTTSSLHIDHSSMYKTTHSGKIQWAVSSGLNHRVQILWLRRDAATRFTCDDKRGASCHSTQHLKHCDALSLHVAAVFQRNTGRRGFSCWSAVRFNLTTKLLCHSEVRRSPSDTQEGFNPSLCTVLLNGHLITAANIYWRRLLEFPHWLILQES